jgi:hypothetical protein
MLCERRGNAEDPALRTIMERLRASGVEVEASQSSLLGDRTSLPAESIAALPQLHGAHVNADFGPLVAPQGQSRSTGEQNTADGSNGSTIQSSGQGAIDSTLMVPEPLGNLSGQAHFSQHAMSSSSPMAWPPVTAADWGNFRVGHHQPFQSLPSHVQGGQPSAAGANTYLQDFTGQDALLTEGILALDDPNYASAWWENWMNVVQRINAVEYDPDASAASSNHDFTTMSFV